MCVFNAAAKLMIYPTAMAAMCGNVLWLPVLADCLLQSLVVWLVCMLAARTDRTFFELLSCAFGRPAARVVYVAFALYFALSAFVPMNEQQAMVHEVFYDTIPSLLTFLPFFFFSAYAGSRGLTNAGRTAEICLPVFAVTVIILVVMGLPECDFSALLPVSAPIKSVVGGRVGGFCRFNEGAVMLLLMGHFRYKRGDAMKITLSCALGGAIVAAVCAVFYAIYSFLAPQQYFAIAKISIFFSAISLIGRTDLMAVYALDIAMLFAIAMYIQLAVYCLSKAFSVQLHPLYSLVINIALFALTLLFNNKFALVQQLGTAVLGWGTLLFACAMPAAGWLAYIVGVKNEKV